MRQVQVRSYMLLHQNICTRKLGRYSIDYYYHVTTSCIRHKRRFRTDRNLKNRKSHLFMRPTIV
jgi:hypothetical protein